jgi:hypothetical protein
MPKTVNRILFFLHSLLAIVIGLDALSYYIFVGLRKCKRHLLCLPGDTNYGIKSYFKKIPEKMRSGP